jgi:hypothetical protein
MWALLILVPLVVGFCWMAWEGRNDWSVGGTSHDREQQRLMRQVRQLRRRQWSNKVFGERGEAD